jgi:hypothetical protein
VSGVDKDVIADMGSTCLLMRANHKAGNNTPVNNLVRDGQTNSFVRQNRAK